MFKPLPFGSASFFSLVLSNNYILNKQVPVVQQINLTLIRLKVIIIKPFTKSLQKGGVPAAPSGTATLLRLSPSHQFYPRTLLAVTYFRYPRLPWLDGRCVQGPGTYSPRRGLCAITSESSFTKSGCRLRSELRVDLRDWHPVAR